MYLLLESSYSKFDSMFKGVSDFLLANQFRKRDVLSRYDGMDSFLFRFSLFPAAPLSLRIGPQKI